MAEHYGESGDAQASNRRYTKRESNATAWAAGTAIVALFVSAASLVVSFYSAHLTGQQNRNAQEQELVALVTDIAQGQQGSSTTNRNAISGELTQLGEAEEANNIINALPRSSVSSVERYIVGTGLENGDDYQPALQLLQKAAKEASDPRTAADAWRAAAEISYKLGLTSQAEGDINLAKGSFDKSDVPNVSKVNNIAYTDLFDVTYRAPIDCSAAINEWKEAARLIKENNNLLSGPNVIPAETNAGKALAGSCHVALTTLKKEIPF